MTYFDTINKIIDDDRPFSSFQTSLTGYLFNKGITSANILNPTKVPIKFGLTPDAFDHLLADLHCIHSEYSHFFRTKTGNLNDHSLKYLKGLLTTQGKRNISNMTLCVPDASYERLQYFISDSNWKDRPLVDQIQKDVVSLMGNRQYGSIHVDESGIGKSGPHSVGAQRQYCGSLGKIDMCQVGVLLSYNMGKDRAILNRELYLPETLANDQEYRRKQKIPDDLIFKTKIDLAFEMILKAVKDGVPFAWVGADSYYGRDHKFRNKLTANDIVYIVDIPDYTKVWLWEPEVGIPEPKGTRRRKPTKMKVLDKDEPLISVSEIRKTADEAYWDEYVVRDSERKEIKAKFLFDRVYLVENDLPGPEQWLITRVDIDTGEVKYQLSNAPFETSKERLAMMSGSRYWIERAIEDVKGTAGFDEYEVRNHRAWHHHTAMCMLAILILTRMQHKHRAETPLLTIHDMKAAYELILPRRQMTTKDVAKYLFEKHRRRMQARISHHKRYRLKRMKET